MFGVSYLSFDSGATKEKLSSIQWTSIRKSIDLFLKSEIYNSIINTTVNYQSSFRLVPNPKHVFIVDDEEWDLYAFFPELRRMLIIYGFVLLRIEGSKRYRYYSPSLLKQNSYTLTGTNIQVNGETVRGFKTLAGEVLPLDECVIIANTPLRGIDVILPEYFYILDEIEKIEAMKYSIYTKRSIADNVAMLLKIKDSSEGIGFGRTDEEVEKIKTETQAVASTLTIRPGSVITVYPDSELEIPQGIQSKEDEEYLFKRLSEISASVNIPSFLITGDLKELNYAASRSALQDFVIFSNRQIARLVNVLKNKLKLDGRLTLPPPTTISTAEAIKYFEFMKSLADDPKYQFSIDELKMKLILGGLL